MFHLCVCHVEEHVVVQKILPKTIEVPQIEYVEKRVRVHAIQEVLQYVEVPQIQCVDKDARYPN